MRTYVASPADRVEAAAGTDHRAGLLAGLLAGVAIAPIMMAMTHAWSVGQHVFFGLVLGLAYKAWRRE